MLKRNLILLAVAALIIVLPLIFVQDKTFRGTDDIAASAVSQLDPGFKPWFRNVFKPDSAMETFLFSLQAAAGAGVIGFILGRITAKPGRDTKGQTPEKAGDADAPSKDGV